VSPVLFFLPLLLGPVLLVVHQDLGYVELRDGRHAAGPLDFHVPFELSRVVEHVKEAEHDPPANFFLDALKAQFATQEFLETDTTMLAISRL
jgi:hypothetical protein